MVLTPYKEITDHSPMNLPTKSFPLILSFPVLSGPFRFFPVLSGPYLTFSRDKHSLQLKAYCMTKNANKTLFLRGYSQQDSPLVHHLDHFAYSSVLNYTVWCDSRHYALSVLLEAIFIPPT